MVNLHIAPINVRTWMAGGTEEINYWKNMELKLKFNADSLPADEYK